jgi:peptidoglycan/LPS O-acetylase OafA/YrhL
MSLKLLNLQALRGVAVLIVVLFHLADWEVNASGVNATHTFLGSFAYFGFGGVDLFFAISGFIITWVHYDKLGRPAALGNYAFKRFWRIYPSYWLCLAGSVVVFWFVTKADVPGPDLGGWVAWLTLQPVTAPNPFLLQDWTLRYEVFFYLAFGAFFLLPRRSFVPLLWLWFVATAWIRFVARPKLAFFPAFATEPFTLEFLLGCFAAVALRRGAPVGARTCVLLGVAGFAAGAWLFSAGLIQPIDFSGERFLLYGIPSGLLVYGLTARELAGGRPLPRWLQSLGDASYSIYLWHVSVFFVVLFRTQRLVHTPGPHLVWLGLMFGATVAVGYLCYYRVERPLLDWARRRRTVRPVQVPAERRSAA